MYYSQKDTHHNFILTFIQFFAQNDIYYTSSKWYCTSNREQKSNKKTFFICINVFVKINIWLASYFMESLTLSKWSTWQQFIEFTWFFITFYLCGMVDELNSFWSQFLILQNISSFELGDQIHRCIEILSI